MIESKIKDYGQWRMMKENLENEDAATASTQWSAELEDMNYVLHTLEERKFEYSGGEVSRQSSVAEFTIRRSSTRACFEGC